MLCQVTQEDFHGVVVYSETHEIVDLQLYAVNCLRELHKPQCPIFKVLIICADSTEVDITRQAAAFSKVISYSDLFHYEK